MGGRKDLASKRQLSMIEETDYLDEGERKFIERRHSKFQTLYSNHQQHHHDHNGVGQRFPITTVVEGESQNLTQLQLHHYNSEQQQAKLQLQHYGVDRNQETTVLNSIADNNKLCESVSLQLQNGDGDCEQFSDGTVNYYNNNNNYNVSNNTIMNGTSGNCTGKDVGLHHRGLALHSNDQHSEDNNYCSNNNVINISESNSSPNMKIKKLSCFDNDTLILNGNKRHLCREQSDDSESNTTNNKNRNNNNDDDDGDDNNGLNLSAKDSAIHEMFQVLIKSMDVSSKDNAQPLMELEDVTKIKSLLYQTDERIEKQPIALNDIISSFKEKFSMPNAKRMPVSRQRSRRNLDLERTASSESDKDFGETSANNNNNNNNNKHLAGCNLSSTDMTKSDTIFEEFRATHGHERLGASLSSIDDNEIIESYRETINITKDDLLHGKDSQIEMCPKHEETISISCDNVVIGDRENTTTTKASTSNAVFGREDFYKSSQDVSNSDLRLMSVDSCEDSDIVDIPVTINETHPEEFDHDEMNQNNVNNNDVIGKYDVTDDTITNHRSPVQSPTFHDYERSDLGKERSPTVTQKRKSYFDKGRQKGVEATTNCTDGREQHDVLCNETTEAEVDCWGTGGGEEQVSDTNNGQPTLLKITNEKGNEPEVDRNKNITGNDCRIVSFTDGQQSLLKINNEEGFEPEVGGNKSITGNDCMVPFTNGQQTLLKIIGNDDDFENVDIGGEDGEEDIDSNILLIESVGGENFNKTRQIVNRDLLLMSVDSYEGEEKEKEEGEKGEEGEKEEEREEGKEKEEEGEKEEEEGEEKEKEEEEGDSKKDIMCKDSIVPFTVEVDDNDIEESDEMSPVVCSIIIPEIRREGPKYYDEDGDGDCGDDNDDDNYYKSSVDSECDECNLQICSDIRHLTLNSDDNNGKNTISIEINGNPSMGNTHNNCPLENSINTSSLSTASLLTIPGTHQPDKTSSINHPQSPNQDNKTATITTTTATSPFSPIATPTTSTPKTKTKQANKTFLTVPQADDNIINNIINNNHTNSPVVKHNPNSFLNPNGSIAKPPMIRHVSQPNMTAHFQPKLNNSPSNNPQHPNTDSGNPISKFQKEDLDSDLAKLKATAVRLNLTTRRPSYLRWLEDRKTNWPPAGTMPLGNSPNSKSSSRSNSPTPTTRSVLTKTMSDSDADKIMSDVSNFATKFKCFVVGKGVVKDSCKDTTDVDNDDDDDDEYDNGNSDDGSDNDNNGDYGDDDSDDLRKADIKKMKSNFRMNTVNKKKKFVNETNEEEDCRLLKDGGRSDVDEVDGDVAMDNYVRVMALYPWRRFGCCPGLNHDRLTPDRKMRIDKSLDWLKTELKSMRHQDQQLARQLLSIRQEIHTLKYSMSYQEHREHLEEVQCDLEDLQEFANVLDLPSTLYLDAPLKNVGVTKWNITARRFSTC